MWIITPKNNFDTPSKENKTNIELLDLEIKVNINWVKEFIVFYIWNKAIWKIEFSTDKKWKINEILYIWNFIKNKNIKWIWTYMIKYILDNFVEEKLTIWNISKIAFYDKLVKKLLEKWVIKKYSFCKYKDETDLILYKK